MTLVVYGFPTQVQALQFEWAWQHPTKSKAVRKVATQIGQSGSRGVKGKIRLMIEMLHLSPWRYFPLTLQYLSSTYAQLSVGKEEHIRWSISCLFQASSLHVPPSYLLLGASSSPMAKSYLIMDPHNPFIQRSMKYFFSDFQVCVPLPLMSRC